MNWISLGQLNVLPLNDKVSYHLGFRYIASAGDILAMLLASHSHPLFGSHLKSLLPSLPKHKRKEHSLTLVLWATDIRFQELYVRSFLLRQDKILL